MKEWIQIFDKELNERDIEFAENKSKTHKFQDSVDALCNVYIHHYVYCYILHKFLPSEKPKNTILQCQFN